jgi:hypothetical protein
MKTTIINGKKYTVEHVFNMVGNWEFTDKNGVIHLVDGEDVAIFAGAGTCDYELDGTDTDGTKWYLCTMHDTLALSQDAPCAKWVNNPVINEDTAIAYAKHLAQENEDGVFWWQIK